MIRSSLFYRALVGSALVGGMVLLWAGSVVHYGDGDPSDPVAVLADIHAHPGATIAKAVLDVASVLCFLMAAIGLAATVRGRGRASTVGTAVLIGLGVPSHILGASFFLTFTKLTQAALTRDQEIRVASRMIELQDAYFIGLVPFLLALVLIPAALWRARIVSWVPFALVAVDLVVVGQFTGSTTPSSPLWWIDPVLTIAAYVWLAIGLLRYRPGERAVATAAPAPAAAPV
jgi:Domain of unknown function (DUF4386)